MKLIKFTVTLAALAAFAGFAACGGTTSPTGVANLNVNSANVAAASALNIKEVPRPPQIADLMKQRGAQDEAEPTLKIIEPRADAVVSSSTVKVKLELSGDLKGYQPMKDMTTGMGNHIHVILDNQPYEAYYNLGEDFELRDVADGAHVLRVFPSRPWHESYKNEGAFQMIKFTVKNGANNSDQAATNANAAGSEGKTLPNSTAGAVDVKKPLLTYSRPKGVYKGADAENIMIDFWVSNVRLQQPTADKSAKPSAFRVRYSIDGDEWRYIDVWQPIWLTGWTEGNHKLTLELVDAAGNVVENGGFNSTTREITVNK